MKAEELERVLRELYERQSAERPRDSYLALHRGVPFLSGTVKVFEFYKPYLPPRGAILDWGCRHAPDSCLVRALLGSGVELDGCDVIAGDEYPVFYEYAGLRYQRLQESVRLPYEDSRFDVVIASGVLEHVPMDYESLKELYRVLKPKGRLVITYLPNRASVQEWWLRVWHRERFHQRLYSRAELRRLLGHAGFVPLILGYQTRLDKLPGGGAIRLLRWLGLHGLTSCLCAVAEKTAYF